MYSRALLSLHRAPRLMKVRSFSAVSFALSEDQTAYRDLARKFAQEEMLPKAAEYDRTMAFPKEIFNAAWELGLVNTHVPPELGGLGLHCLDNCIIMEELAYACTGS